jgi:hypothetical protein
MRSTICVAEDREVCEPCLKLLLLSLNACCPNLEVSLFYAPAGAQFRSWLRKCPQVHLQTAALKSGYGWNVKPQAIINLLDSGFDEVLWLDSDIIVTRDPRLSALPKDSFVITENTLVDERCDGKGLRARLWGFEVGRVLPFSLNSCVLRATKTHYRLMERWWELLHAKAYQECQRKPWRERPVHMLGDQDVLTALLASEEFAGTALHILRRGKDIIQFDGVNGYTVSERLGNLLGRRPAFIHSCAGKPWSEHWQWTSSDGIREYVKQIYLDLSPYTLSARQFRQELESSTEWMEPHYRLSRILRSFGLGRPALVGLPMALLSDLARVAKSIKEPPGAILGRLETAGLGAAGKS